MSTTALIAEDEPLLAQALARALQHEWPQLQVLETVADGNSAVERSLALRPDLLFFDIRMPGQDGLQAAAELADAWPAGSAFPLLVFVTAFDHYAVQAFEAQAIDYVQKPVQPQRLRRTVARLQAEMSRRAAGGQDEMLERLRSLLGAQPAAAPPTPLRFIAAAEPGSGGSVLRMVPVAEVLVFEAADKYVRVLTAGREYLVRSALRELSTQLDPEVFWQIHRGLLVRADAIDTVERDETGRLHLCQRGLPQRWPVGRLYAARFKAL
ncbi:response regulator [Xylophilus rhododendri]|uniref:Response regulator n=1 Tax=Xylophilus rhododendri TaxID=2697032 RepID=A0A857JAR4_9BURK|nr:LytTR family DNA-binding domain-containing protein [Xylophilus rhododendri]QHJ01111.1 response regulator [Xylophilus rhododendri]